MILKDNTLYQIGKECPYGYYIISSESASEDMDFEQYKEYPPISTFRRYRCFFGSVRVQAPYEYIRINNGSAIYIGENPFDLYGLINKAELTEGIYYAEGVDAFSNELCRIKVHFRDSTPHLFLGQMGVELSRQNIFSINNRFFLQVSVDVKSYRPYNSIVFAIHDGLSGKTYPLGEGGAKRCSLSEIDYSVSDTELKYIPIPHEQFYVIGLPLGIDIRNMTISWVQPNTSEGRLYPTEEGIGTFYFKQYEKLRSVLEKFNRIGLNINIEHELEELNSAPDFAEMCSSFLDAEYKSFFGRKPTTDNAGTYTFRVDASYDKKYYCAAKLAESAVEISANNEKTAFWITFDYTQVEKISLMYYNLGSPLDEDDKSLVAIRGYLDKTDFFFHLTNSINDLVASLREQFGYSSYVSNSVLIRILKQIRRLKQNEIDAIYNEIARENRVAAKWSSEYKLFTLVQSYVSDAVYQYHADWLGLQSFDIFLPSKNIAIEYQGKQHYEAIEIFGGQEALLDNQERDARKRQLSLENDVVVLDWKYDTSVNEDNVRSFLLENNIILPGDHATGRSLVNSSTLDMAPVRERAQKQKSQKVHIPKISPYVIRQYNTDGCFIKEFNSISEASGAVGVSAKSINNVIYGYRKSGGGYIWKRCERLSQIENVQPVVQAENTGIGKAIIQMDMNDQQIAEYPSKRAASISTGVNVRSISDALSGIQKSAGGFKWKYSDK